MSDPHFLSPGDTKVYTTRPVGMSTSLFSQLVGRFPSRSLVTWHVELCCKPTNVVELTNTAVHQSDISDAAGALVTVGNAGAEAVVVWTDYI